MLSDQSWGAGQISISPHVSVHERLWLDTRPRTSASAHLFLKAVEIVEQERSHAHPAQQSYLDRPSAREAWELGRAFFEFAKDISDWQVHREIADQLGIEYGCVEVAGGANLLLPPALTD